MATFERLGLGPLSSATFTQRSGVLTNSGMLDNPLQPGLAAALEVYHAAVPTNTIRREGGSNPTGEHLAILESQVAQLLAYNRQLRDGQVKANTYHRHFNRKLDWLITDAARRRRLPPEMPEAGPSGLSKKRRRVVDSDEEEEMGMEKEKEEVEVEVEGEEEEEVEEGEGEEAPAPKRAKTVASVKGKEKEVLE
ncbi:hypothetical protein F5876DRAFT_82874 [Lentinula aff. lateritia]|uniref:Uncharacterized protein n=1 Tax=Lentinula aff. lateritia TaxID=2804960 RepID=A0ACC1TJ81_9AGAR|nr:hypothetical protein F5876DRAFT_82874 [Lentinula aff. lateritia]